MAVRVQEMFGLVKTPAVDGDLVHNNAAINI
jgi:hypothetical protein